MPRFDKSQYVKGMHMHGAAFGPDGSIWPPAPERKPAPKGDPRVEYLKACTADLTALKAKFVTVEKQIEALAAKVKRR